jgi:3-deoxy-D-manno-octulosonic-acid transferase
LLIIAVVDPFVQINLKRLQIRVKSFRGKSELAIDNSTASCWNTPMIFDEVSKWKQHLAFDLPQENQHSIWLHACSVGEVGSVSPLVNKLLEDGEELHITVVTRTGFAHAKRLFGSRVSISYLPWDIPGLIRRFVNHLKPQLLLLTETEFWPGMIATCHRHAIPIVSINTRISDKSFPRYYATRILWRRWLSPIAQFLAQSELDAERLIAIGVNPSRIQVTDNLKYATLPPKSDPEALLKHLDFNMNRPVILAASTHKGEDDALLEMLPSWKRLQSNLLFVIAPRHPERFPDVAKLISKSEIPFSHWSKHEGHNNVDIVLIDAMGILPSLYTIADIVIIGGSIVSHGGHNPLESAICGRGVITGPHIQNFRLIMEDMQQANAAIVAQSANDLDKKVQHLLLNPDDLQTLNAHAINFMKGKAKILEVVLDTIRLFIRPPPH